MDGKPRYRHLVWHPVFGKIYSDLWFQETMKPPGLRENIETMKELKEKIEKFKVDNLKVRVYPGREALGKAAAGEVATYIKNILAKNEEMNMVFAVAPSQEEFYKYIVQQPGLNWCRVTGFQMDEYLGLPEDSEAGFGVLLKKRLFDKLPFKKINYLNPRPMEPEKECARYSALLRSSPIDAVVMGIGENGHIAFNDPPVADFEDPKMVKIIRLDDSCRRQQVNDGCFPSLKDVPPLAMTLTVPALMSGERLFCIVPGNSKANAVRQALYGPISTSCPASILREHPNATLFLDNNSASRL